MMLKSFNWFSKGCFSNSRCYARYMHYMSASVFHVPWKSWLAGQKETSKSKNFTRVFVCSFLLSVLCALVTNAVRPHIDYNGIRQRVCALIAPEALSGSLSAREPERIITLWRRYATLLDPVPLCLPSHIHNMFLSNTNTLKCVCVKNKRHLPYLPHCHRDYQRPNWRFL